MRVIFQWGNCPAHRLHSYHEDCKTKHDISHIFVVCLFDKHLKNNTDNRNNGRNGCRGQQLCDTAGPINIGTKEAQGFIDSYFETYPKIKEFLDNTVAQAKEKGYTRTLFGRIRPIPELSSGNFMTRQFGERVAMNAPIQGTAADIIKIAMIRVHDRLIREHFRSRLILQVHDELLIETAEEEKEKVIALLEEEMQKAADLKVELAVGTACGQDWYEAH